MSAHPSTMPASTSDPVGYLRYLDVVLLVMAVPFAIALGAPALGVGVGAAAWLIQRAVHVALERKAKQIDARKAVGLALASSLGRAWLTGIAILAVGLAAEREDGLAAGIVVLGSFTVYFALNLIVRPLERKSK